MDIFGVRFVLELFLSRPLSPFRTCLCPLFLVSLSFFSIDPYDFSMSLSLSLFFVVSASEHSKTLASGHSPGVAYVVKHCFVKHSCLCRLLATLEVDFEGATCIYIYIYQTLVGGAVIKLY